MNPLLGDTDAVTLPLEIKVATCASGVNAERGISNNPAPLPLKNEPLDKTIFPKNFEPLACDSTTNPKSGETEAVTLPLAIFADSTDGTFIN